MLRISKLTDYGIVLLARFAAEESGATRTAREMAEATALPLPVASKMLKALAGAGLLQSQRGSKGGYALARRPERVSVASIIEALEGPIALMECSAGPGHCDQESGCPVSAPWQRINRAIQETLERVTLRDLVAPGGGGLLGIEGALPGRVTRGARGESTLRPS
jgi:FeS assembly SUF system regulator